MSDVIDKARALLDQRLDSLRGIEESQAKLTTARDAVHAAEADQVNAWAAALSAGWNEAELRKLGLDQPVIRRPGRPKGGRTRRSSASPAEVSTTSPEA